VKKVRPKMKSLALLELLHALVKSGIGASKSFALFGIYGVARNAAKKNVGYRPAGTLKAN
jgi:hypothetical protein